MGKVPLTGALNRDTLMTCNCGVAPTIKFNGPAKELPVNKHLHRMGRAAARPHRLVPSASAFLTDPVPPFALLLAAHGERGNGRRNDGVGRLASALTGRGVAAEVGVGYIKGVPGIEETLRGFEVPDVLVYPLFLADGYFSRVRLPRLIAAAQAASPKPRRVRVLPPLGLDPALADVVAATARRMAGEIGIACDAATLVLVAHGTPRHKASRQAAETLARRLETRALFRGVRAAFLEEPPSLAEVIAGVGGPVLVVGLLAGEGLHGGVDVPHILEEIARADVAFAGNIGTFTDIADIVAAAVRRASTDGGE